MDSSERYCYDPYLQWNPQVEEYFTKAYGADHFARISKALTHPSCYSCLRVNILNTTPDAVIQKLLEMRNVKVENSASNEVEKEYDNVQILKDNPNGGGINRDFIHRCPIPGLDYVVYVRGSGPHEVGYAHSPAQPMKEVIVSRKCAEAVLRGAQIYVPGVLACSSHVEKGDTVAVSVALEQREQDGKWGTGITRGTVLQGLETDPHYVQRKGLYIGQGTTMMSRASIFRALDGVAICMTNRVYDLPSFNNVLESEIFLQNLPSIIAAHSLDPQEGERIFDMCAAPGGKTTAIAMLMRDQGEVVAADRSHNKVIDVQNLAAEMGLKCVITYKLDALKSVARKVEPDVTELNAAGEIASEICVQPGEACVTENENTPTSKLGKQRKKNGPGKNNYSGFIVEKSGLVGHYEFSDGYVERWLKPGEEDLVQRFDPSSSDTIGFFIAKFKVGCKDS